MGGGGGGGGSIGNWVWPKGDIHPFNGGRRVKLIEYKSYCSDTLNCVSLATLSFQGYIIFYFPASKTWPEEQIFWGIDPLGVPDLNFVQESKKRTECPRGRVRVLSWQGENNSYKFFNSVLPAELMNTSWKSAFDFCSGGKLSLATDWTKTTISFSYRRNTKVLETNPFIWTLWTVYTLISYA